MRHKVHQRDWFFNAGIVGFLNVVFDGENLEKNTHFDCGENFISFDDAVFEFFEEKFIKQAFLSLFRIKPFITKLEYLEKEIDKETKGKKNPASLLKSSVVFIAPKSPQMIELIFRKSSGVFFSMKP